MNNKTQPLISIIIPTYNHAKFISKALNSVISQNYKNWEAIIIDNNSIDQTEKILSRYKDPRIKNIKINNNGIIAKSRNLGIELSKGEWIAFLDSDDWWTEDKLQICVNNINKDVDFIYHDLEVKGLKPKFFIKKKIFKGRQLNRPIFKDLLFGMIKEGNAIANSSVFVRKKIITGIGGISENPNLVASEDYNTWLRVAKTTDNFKYIKKRLGFYLTHNVSAQNKDLSFPHREAIKEFMYLLNYQQKINLEVKLKYMSACYNASARNHSKANKNFMYVLINGSFNLKLRSFIKIILLFFKS